MLFKTERYRRLEELLKARAKAMETRRREIAAQEAALLAASGEETLEAHIAVSAEKRKSLAALEKEAEARRETHEAAQKAEQKGIREAELLMRWEKARTALADHEKKRGDVERFRVQLGEAERAAQLEDAANSAAHDREKRKAREIEREAAEKSRIKAAAEKQCAEEAAAREKDREPELAAQKEKVRKLTEYGVLAQELSQAAERLKICEDAARQAAAKAAKVKKAREETAAALLALSAREKELAEQAAKAEGLSLALAQKEKERELRQNLAVLEKRAAQAEKTAESAREKAAQAMQETEAKEPACFGARLYGRAGGASCARSERGGSLPRLRFDAASAAGVQRSRRTGKVGSGACAYGGRKSGASARGGGKGAGGGGSRPRRCLLRACSGEEVAAADA